MKTLHYEDLEDVLSEKCLVELSNHKKLLIDERSIVDKYGSFNFKYSFCNNITFGEHQYKFTDNTKLFGNVEGEFLNFTFIKYGTSNFSCSSIKESYMRPNTFNVFYVNNETNSLIKYKNETHYDHMGIMLPKTLFDDMFEKHPDMLRSIDDKINRKHSFALYENGININHKTIEILHDLKTAHLLGNAASMFIEAKILELFALLLCNQENTISVDVTNGLRDKMFEAKYIIEKQYSNPPTINELAKHLGICNTTMKNCFKKVFNNTVYGCLLDYRMKKAEEFLKNNPELNMFEIAQLLGYEHQANFSVAFKRKYGVSPLEFRNNN